MTCDHEWGWERVIDVQFTLIDESLIEADFQVLMNCPKCNKAIEVTFSGHTEGEFYE